MPHLNFKHVDKEVVRAASVVILEELATAFDCEQDHVSFDYIKSKSYLQGDKVKGDPMVIIEMFDRGDEVRNAVVKILMEFLRETYSGDIAIVFQNIEPKMYFENGENFE